MPSRASSTRVSGIQLALAVVAAATLVAALTSSARGATPASTWRVDLDPFRLYLLQGDAELVSETTPGPRATAGTRLGYRLSDGSSHAATKVVARRPIARGERFTLATEEPGRTIVLDLTRTAHGGG